MFAYEKGQINYCQIADTAAGLAKHYLKLPVTVVTNNKEYVFQYADNVIVNEPPPASTVRTFDGKSTPWHNGNRSSVYELSPYDQTLMIDADYYILSNDLKQLFDTDMELACYDTAVSVTTGLPMESHSRLAPASITMQWATVVYFRKCEFAKSVFEFISIIRDNWEFYSMLYGFTNRMFRNDYALSIALQALSGFSGTNHCVIPGKLLTADADSHVVNVAGLVYLNTSQGLRVVNNQNIHFMNKADIMSDYITVQFRRIFDEKIR